MGLFDLFGKKSSSPEKKIREVPWSKNAKGKFRRLAFIELAKENISSTPGVFVAWHGGARPGWVYVGLAEDLAIDLTDMRQNKEVMEFDRRGGLFVTWYTPAPADRKGVFVFLNDVLQPEVRNPEADQYENVTPIKVLPPGYKMEAFAKMIR